jgi:hypothetical protein
VPNRPFRTVCFAQHCATIVAERMTPFFYPARNNWRVQIPASETEIGRQRTGSSFTVCEAYYARQVKEKRSDRTLNDDRWRLNRLAMALGATSANDCTAADLFQYLETIPPGSNRRSHFKTLKKLAYALLELDKDPQSACDFPTTQTFRRLRSRLSGSPLTALPPASP